MDNKTIIAATMLIMSACSESLQETDDIIQTDTATTTSALSHWGNKIEDPYTVSNMRRAYDELTKNKSNSLAKNGLLKEEMRMLDSIIMEAAYNTEVL